MTKWKSKPNGKQLGREDWFKYIAFLSNNVYYVAKYF